MKHPTKATVLALAVRTARILFRKKTKEEKLRLQTRIAHDIAGTFPHLVTAEEVRTQLARHIRLR